MPAVLLTVASTVAIACPVLAAEADFSTSTAAYEPSQVIAGDILHFIVAIANTGGDSGYARIKSTLPRGYFIRAAGDCAAATLDEKDRSLVWHEGAFPAGSIRQCRLDLLTRREAAGTINPLVTEIRTMPSGYVRLEATPELEAPPTPAAIRIGPFGLTWAGLGTVAFFGFSIAGAAIVARVAKQRGGMARTAVRAWLAVAAAIGFLLIFLALAWDDLRSYRDYRETSCHVFDSTIRAFQGDGKSARSHTYAPVFAVRYAAFGAETYASAYPPATAVSLGWIGHSQQILDRFSIGSVHPCWFDPDDVRTVLLERGPGAAYLFALLPLMTLAYGALSLIAAVRPTREQGGLSD